MSTPRLHYDDPLLLRAEARIVGHGRRGDRETVVLDETIFYPESGGQLGDRGRIGDARIEDVRLDADGVVHHVVDEGPLPSVGAEVACAVDEAHRRQHMALHTAQHCLSRALLDLHGAVTVSSRLGASGCTIDVDRSGLDLASLSDAQDAVNRVVDEDRPVRQFFPSAAELDELALRKPPPAVDGRIRVVDVDGFDVTPCGGTHVTHTSQIQLLLLCSAERYKGGTRITFEAGPRARRALLDDRATLTEAARLSKCAAHELVEVLEKHRAQVAELRRETGTLRGRLADRWAEDLSGRRGRTIVATLSDADAPLLKAVAARLATGARRVALAAPSADGVDVLIARGPEAEGHAGELMKALAAEVGGRGGGRETQAQGRLPTGAPFETIVERLWPRSSTDG